MVPACNLITSPEGMEALPPLNTPLPTPSPTIPPSALILEVIPGQVSIVYGNLHVAGEVRNTTDSWVQYIEVIMTFYDADGEILKTASTYVLQDAVAPDSTGVFEISADVGSQVASVMAYEFKAYGMEPTSILYQDLELTARGGYFSSGYYHFPGEVKNTGSSDCQHTQIIAGFYNAGGRIVRADFTYANPDKVPAGSSAPFEFILSDLEEDGFDTYKLWANCWPMD